MVVGQSIEGGRPCGSTTFDAGPLLQTGSATTGVL